MYGDLAPNDPPFTEESPYKPSSPYSASKAASDHLVQAWHRTYGLPTLITHCSNNFGAYQHSEKLIPKMITNALQGKPLPIYGDGQQIRDWLYVDDHVQALHTALQQGKVGETYNIGGNCEKTNLEVIQTICELLDNLMPVKSNGIKSYSDLITFITDRPGHDKRYAIDNTKITTHLNWHPPKLAPNPPLQSRPHHPHSPPHPKQTPRIVIKNRGGLLYNTEFLILKRIYH